MVILLKQPNSRQQLQNEGFCILHSTEYLFCILHSTEYLFYKTPALARPFERIIFYYCQFNLPWHKKLCHILVS